MTSQEKLDALSRLSEMGSHKIVAFEWANEIGKPFGVAYKGDHSFKVEPGLGKHSVLEDCEGIDVHGLASRIIDEVINEIEPNHERHMYHGRGTQFREDIKTAIELITVNDFLESTQEGG